jgi:hypothetical protein
VLVEIACNESAPPASRIAALSAGRAPLPREILRTGNASGGGYGLVIGAKTGARAGSGRLTAGKYQALGPPGNRTRSGNGDCLTAGTGSSGRLRTGTTSGGGRPPGA